MPDYIIKGCTVADDNDLGRNNMSAFWQDPNWRLVWKTVDLPFVIEQASARVPRLLLKDRDTMRHFKAVDPETGKLVGYIRWTLPIKHCKNEDGSPVWPEGQTPDVSPEEKARLIKRAEAADWNPSSEADHLDDPVGKKKKEFLAKKDYLVIEYFAVHPENQGKGVGTALLKHGIEKAQELGIDIFVLAFVGGFRAYNNAGFITLDSLVQDATAYGGNDNYAVQFMEYRVDDTTKAIKTDPTFDTWFAYAEKPEDRGDCSDDLLVNFDDGCHNVDTFISGRRINCVNLDINAL
ncbi:hypothetical protein VM1G_02388 [Cytospora mali]|uniref:N-acetyltransferase domain-containing protein n=1 Tax=Cytospora mali TaxID=578113 RepID=A0A194VQ63_CYTMA|nr:hypothetical protein VM1G_02388 [Valsa mali]